MSDNITTLKKLLGRYFHSVGFKIALYVMISIIILFPTYAFISLTRQHHSMVKNLNTLEQIMKNNMEQQELSLTENLARTFKNAILGMDFSLLKSSVNAIMKNNNRISYCIIFHQSGISLVSNFRRKNRPLAEKALSQKYENIRENKIENIDYYGEPVMEVYTPVIIGEKIWGSLIFGFSQADLNQKIDKIRQHIEKEKKEASAGAILTTFVFLLITALSIIFASRHVSKPLQKLAQGAKTIGQGNLDWEIRLNTKDEIGMLANSFNQMAQDLKGLLVQAEEKKRMEIELTTAQTIQRFILPKEAPQIAGLQFAGILKTSSEIGGDFFDFFSLDNNRKVAMIIGDVSGHGVAAGLVVAAIKGALLMQAKQDKNASQLLQSLNSIVYQVAKQELLTTCFLGIFDSKTKKLNYSNAGHNFPYLFKSRKNKLVELDYSDFPLGLSRTTNFNLYSTILEPADFLILYTDGIIETTNPVGEAYSYDRFEQSILENINANAVTLRNSLLNRAMSFYEGKAIDDDITLLVVRQVNETLS